MLGFKLFLCQQGKLWWSFQNCADSARDYKHGILKGFHYIYSQTYHTIVWVGSKQVINTNAVSFYGMRTVHLQLDLFKLSCESGTLLLLSLCPLPTLTFSTLVNQSVSGSLLPVLVNHYWVSGFPMIMQYLLVYIPTAKIVQPHSVTH